MTRSFLDTIDVTPEVILEVIATRKDFRTNDAVCRLVFFEHIRMMLPDVSHAGSEALALGETEVAAEHGLSAPIFLRRVAARRCFEPEIT